MSFSATAQTTISDSIGNQLYRQTKNRQPVIHAGKAQATSYTGNPPKHRQPVIQAAQAQATSYTSNPGPENRQLIAQEAQSQATSSTSSARKATSYIGSASTGNQLYT